MKFTTALPVALCAGLAVAAPAGELERRTSYNGGTTANDVKNGGMSEPTISLASNIY